MDRYGSEGYLVFFGILEIYSREFKPEPNWKLSITRAYLKQKLHKRQDTLPVKILKHIQKSGKWEVLFEYDQLTIFIPKFHEMVDEWMGRKLRSHSVVTPKILKTEVDKEEDTDKPTPLYSDSFIKFWNIYPRKIGKGAAYKSWKRKPKGKGISDIILNAVLSQKQSEQWKKDNGQFIPNPATWLNQRRWEDEGIDNRPKYERVPGT